MNTAEKIEPTITEQIAAEKEKLSLMRKRSHDATETLVNHQRELDEAWDKSINFYFIKYANTLFSWTGNFFKVTAATDPQQTSGVSTISTSYARYILIKDLFVAAFFYSNISQGLKRILYLHGVLMDYHQSSYLLRLLLPNTLKYRCNLYYCYVSVTNVRYRSSTVS